MVLHLSGMLCQSPRHARAHRGHNILATVVLEVAGCESLRGRTGSHYSSVRVEDVFLFARTNALLSMRNLPERHKHFSVARWHVGGEFTMG